ncbi:hypothetical protein GCM10020358_24900 [Amorphoplanes nipponensis]|uniref:Uncharacterized protein n=1 Tax=Actinoplanes nipponensis TaxID=135950 RepID=A0A919MXK6_9ACTN|nr:hypothetical protein [Actinoplanes nipponensis]GIE53405.1 hypothetical protein Ani05nite_69390 [Actinoplanes nipponensis]
MQLRIQPADEPYESRDLELGVALRSWAAAQSSALAVKLDGPLEAPGMDPTWSLEMRGEYLEALVHLFYGPIADVSVIWSPEDEIYVGAAQDFSDLQLVSMLDDLAAASQCGVVPPWLRPAAEA